MTNPIDEALDKIDAVLLEWETVKRTAHITSETIERGRAILAYEKYKQER
jgi:hypothetical protein